MNKILLTTLFLAVTAFGAKSAPDQQVCCEGLLDPSAAFTPVVPHYMPGIYLPDSWKSNWFFGVSGGAMTYLGKNVSCDDFFGRTRWLGRAQLGKWHSPTVATRIAFDAFAFEDIDNRNENYQAYHLDVMWNPVALWSKEGKIPRWAVMPYVGCGFAHNSTFGINRFAFTYGVAAKYRLGGRIDLIGELGGLTTWRDLDGCGCCREFDANFLGLSVGASIVIGKDGWERVLDARPYIDRNEDLMAYSLALRDANRSLASRHEQDERIINEYNKILGIEGLLGKYADRIQKAEADTLQTGGRYPRNNYSGLNSLRRRLGILGPEVPVVGSHDKNAIYQNYGYVDPEGETVILGSTTFPGKDMTEEEFNALVANGVDTANVCRAGVASDGLRCFCGHCVEQPFENPDCCEELARVQELFGLGDESWADYMEQISNGDRCIGAPVFFFFRINTTKLTDPSQMVNLTTIAKVANAYNLKIRVYGAADAKTGNDRINDRLSADRANLIASELREAGVDPKSITVFSEGGIDDYYPVQANRNTRVELYR
ncbi:MAG: OmpA family protein [Bacteroidales bacterium]|nr:OmpA family protein [Bacteroidales bacterium]